MNIDQLTESLSGNAPEPDHVLASFGRKRRAARNRMFATSGGLAVAIVAVVAGVLLRGASRRHRDRVRVRPGQRRRRRARRRADRRGSGRQGRRPG